MKTAPLFKPKSINKYPLKKFRIQETPTLLIVADSRTDTNLKRSHDLSNERPRKKLHSMAQTHEHGNFMANSAQWGRVVKKTVRKIPNSNASSK